MKIRDWHVDGFGVLHDWRVERLSDGPSVFYGPNEAGKSTLLAFLRGVLFGFPDGRSREPKYPALAGGRHGGRITLEGDVGEFVVERHTGRDGGLVVTGPGGRAASEAELNVLLGHADEKLFRSVFAFSLSELQSFKSLGAKGIQDHIFSAGITGAGRSARDALDRLEKSARALYHPGRGASRSLELLEEIAEIDGELALRRDAARGYGRLAEREKALAAQVAQLRERAEIERRGEEKSGRLLQLWRELWCPLVEAERALAEFEVPERFPENAEARLDSLLQRFATEERDAEDLEDDLGSCDAQLSSLAADEAAASVADRVDELYRGQSLYEANREALALARRELEEIESRLARSLREDLAADWTEEKLLAFDRSLARADEAQHWELQRAALAQDSERVLSRSERRSEERERIRARSSRCRELRDEIESVDPEQLRERTRALRSARGLFGRLSTADAEIEARRSSLEEWLSADVRARGVGGVPRRWVALAAAGLVAVAAWRSGASDAVISAFGVGAALLGWLVARALEKFRSPVEADAGAARLRDSLVRLEHEREVVAQELRVHAAELGVRDALEASVLESVGAVFEEQRSLLAKREHFDEELREHARDLAECEASLRVLAEEWRALDAAMDSAETEWSEWKRALGVPAGLASASVREFFAAVGRARELLDGRDAARGELDRLGAEVASWESAAREALAAAPEANQSPGVGRGRPLLEEFAVLRRRCDSLRRERETRVPLEAQRVELGARHERALHRLAITRDEIAALLAEGDSSSREAFRHTAAQVRRRDALRLRIDETRAQIATRVGAGPAAESLRDELSAGHVAEWELEAGRSQRAAAELEGERDDVLRRHRDVANELASLEASSELSELELRRGEIFEELAAVLEEWKRIQVGRRLIESTLSRFERERQPDVLREASRLFSRVTGEHYPRIVQSSGTRGFTVLDADGRALRPEDLSRGTAEQLYLCVRLGLIAEFARRSRLLPVVMDDVLVNFDDARAHAMAGVLGEFAAESQLLFFTCRAETRDLLLKTAPNAELRELPAVSADGRGRTLRK